MVEQDDGGFVALAEAVCALAALQQEFGGQKSQFAQQVHFVELGVVADARLVQLCEHLALRRRERLAHAVHVELTGQDAHAVLGPGGGGGGQAAGSGGLRVFPVDHGAVASAKSGNQFDDMVSLGRLRMARDAYLARHAGFLEAPRCRHGAAVGGMERQDGLEDARGSHGVAVVSLEGVDGYVGQSGCLDGF